MGLHAVNVPGTAHLGTGEASSSPVPTQETKRVLGRPHETYWCHSGSAAEETQSTTLANSGNETSAYCCLADGELPERCESSQILGRICDMALRRNVERRLHQTVQGGVSEQHAVETPSPCTRFVGDAWIPKLKACNTWTEWFSLTKEFEHSWHVMLNMNPLESSSVCDPLGERSKRPRDDSDPWNVAWSSDTHRRLEVLVDNKVVIKGMNVVWEVKGDEHAVVDQFVRWFLGGTIRAKNITCSPFSPQELI